MSYTPYGSRFPATKGEAYRYALRHARRIARGPRVHAYSLDVGNALLCGGTHNAIVTGHISGVTCRKCLRKLKDRRTGARYSP